MRASSSRFRRPVNLGNIVGLSTIEPTRPITRCSAAGSCPRSRTGPRRADEAEQAPDRRGLAGAVRSEEAEHAAPRHREVEAVHGDGLRPRGASILLAEALEFDDRVHASTVELAPLDGTGVPPVFGEGYPYRLLLGVELVLDEERDQLADRDMRLLDVRGLRARHVDLDVGERSELAAVLAGERDRPEPWALACSNARTTLADAPLVEIPSRTSPSRPSASTWRANTPSKP